MTANELILWQVLEFSTLFVRFHYYDRRIVAVLIFHGFESLVLTLNEFFEFEGNAFLLRVEYLSGT